MDFIFKSCVKEKIEESFAIKVLRDGKKVIVNAEDLTRGDIVFIKAGDRIPADIRITEARSVIFSKNCNSWSNDH